MDLHQNDISRRLLRHALTAIAAMAALTMQSCSDMLEGIYGPEGEKTTVTLKIEMPQMAVRTRSDISDADASKVDNVWVGIYDAKTGKRKTALTMAKNESPGEHNPRLLVERIETTSGMSHIAAVANAGSNFGVMLDEPDAKLRTVASLLKEADTWEKFQRVVIAQTQRGNVNTPIGSLPMSGIYYAEQKNDPEDWIEANQTPYYIPAGDNITLPGAVHMRRMLSQSRFNIIAGDNITVTPISWQVFNVPDVSYIYEHETNATDDIENAFGEKYTVPSGLFHQFEKAKAKLSDGTEKDCLTFDFWQMENKHEGLEKTSDGNGDYYGAAEYADREREWKTPDEGSSKQTNTGVYKSLCSSPEGGTYNNATYVEIKAKVEYYVTMGADGKTETVVKEGTAGAVQRIGYSTYTVHLGYCEGDKEDEKARDFNCRRNTRYTYNVTIEGLNKIKVEAETDGEPQPGTDGDITDIKDGSIIELDAHYCTFNIELSNKQRQGIKWLLKVPFGKDKETFSYFSEDYKAGGIYEGTDLSGNPFYTWIHFKPTTDAKTIRVYNDGDNNSDLMSLLDLSDITGNPGVDSNGREYTTIDDKPLYYTVFVDEYFYEKDDKGNAVKPDEWRKFVNKDPRILWLVIDRLNISSDKESMFITSDYMIKQNSIMTYYNEKSSTAIGIERENETFGFNLGWSTTANERLKNADMSRSNGRYNMWYYITNGNVDVTEASSSNHIKWQDIADTNYKRIKGTRRKYIAPAYRAKITNKQYPRADESPEPDEGVTYPVYEQKKFSSSSRWPSKKDLGFNPVAGGTELNEVITACLNRNRDEDGDGNIDRKEIKWYIPTTSKYSRMVLGRNSITPPLMDFSMTLVGGNNEDTRFHYASGDKRILWAEEGTSISEWSVDGWDKGAWQIRCIRNLGTDMSTMLKEDPISPAYTHDPAKRTLTMTNYKTEVLRSATVGHLGWHDLTSPLNSPSYTFEYAKEDCTNANTDTELFSDTNLSDKTLATWLSYTTDNTVCGKYYQNADKSDKGTWRVPNQKELEILRFIGVFGEGTDTSNHWMSCTREHYDLSGKGDRRFLQAYQNNLTTNTDGSAYRHVRCVRDVIE